MGMPKRCAVFGVGFFHISGQNNFFFLTGFSFTDTDNSQDSRGREGTIFIPLYHFHPLINIQTFICNFASEMTITYF